MDGVQVALVLLPDGVLHAVSNRDPVTGSQVMSRGIVGSRGERATLASPLGKQVYDLVDGRCLSAEGPGLDVHRVRVRHGDIEVALSVPCDANVSGVSPRATTRVTTS